MMKDNTVLIISLTENINTKNVRKNITLPIKINKYYIT